MASSSHYHYHRDDDDDDDPFETEFEEFFENYPTIPEPRERKRRIFIERNREDGDRKIWNDYFSETPTYPHNLFRRRFRMNKPLFMRIVHRLSTEIEYFQPKEDATERSGISPLQKCSAAIRQLAYGGGADTVDEYVRLGASTARDCLHQFTAAIIHLFGDEYLRRPTKADLERLLHIGNERGFPGMIGSIDCMHWGWKNCPTAWKGMYSRYTGKPTIVLETVASYDLWIWHAFFGAPDTMNDLNILDRSPVFDDIITGVVPEVNFTVNGREYHYGYYLTDGIYPKWAAFIQSIRLPQGPKHSLFAQQQESTQKDVERAFGVLQARFAVIKNPSKVWDKNKISNIMRACIILHNMIVEDERDSYTQFNLLEFQEGQVEDLTYSVDMATNLGNAIERRTSLRDRQAHEQLKSDLVENIWAKFNHFLHNNV